jgi:hypothetical protein
VAADGTHSGTLAGFDVHAVYIWEGSTLLALPLGPHSALSLDGKPTQVWGLAAAEQVQAVLVGGIVTQLTATTAAHPAVPAQQQHVLHALKRALAARVAVSDVVSGPDTWTQTNGSFMPVYGITCGWAPTTSSTKVTVRTDSSPGPSAMAMPMPSPPA